MNVCGKVVESKKLYTPKESNAMLYNERAEWILEQLEKYPNIRVSDISENLHVSLDTARRDLKSMEKKGLVKCLRGGACLPENVVTFSNFRGREIINSSLKQKAAEKALAYVHEGNVIALNAGTTNTVLAEKLAELNFPFTVVTNNFSAVNFLIANPKIRIITAGGIVDSQERSSYGTMCENVMRTFYPDTAFLSINAINEVDGYTDFRIGEIGVMQILARNAKKVIAVMDSSKLGKRSKCTALSKEDVDFIVMDDNVSPNTRKEYQQNGIIIQ